MKILISSIYVSLILSLTSCFTRYKYSVQIEYCNCQASEVIIYTGIEEPYISTQFQAVPIASIGGRKVVNVCSFKVLAKEIL